jgi:hypothetical protein
MGHCNVKFRLESKIQDVYFRNLFYFVFLISLWRYTKKQIPKNKVILQFKIWINTRQTIETMMNDDDFEIKLKIYDDILTGFWGFHAIQLTLRPLVIEQE